MTGNIAITLVLALCTFVLTNVYGTKAYWKEIFWPDVPTWLKAPVPMMPLIEFFGIFTKPFALMIRLFANIMAGHAAVLSLIAIIFITVKSGPVINGSMTVVAVAFGILWMRWKFWWHSSRHTSLRCCRPCLSACRR